MRSRRLVTRAGVDRYVVHFAPAVQCPRLDDCAKLKKKSIEKKRPVARAQSVR